MSKRVIQIICSDDLKVINRITNLFTFRGYSVDSLSSSKMDSSNRYSIYIELDYDLKIIDTIIKLVNKIVEVIETRDITTEVAVTRQPILLKLKECL